MNWSENLFGTKDRTLVSVYEEVPDFTLDLQIPKYEGQVNCWKQAII